jgi:hypothetical protein
MVTPKHRALLLVYGLQCPPGHVESFVHDTPQNELPFGSVIQQV